jgi:predicted MFS family arabinose efflux permease
MAVGVLGSLIFGLADSFGILAIGRALIGIGMAGILMGSLKVFSQWFSPQRFATVSGLLVGIGSSGALIAATPLAWLNNTWGWRTVFVNGAVIVALVALSIVVWTRNTPPGVAWTGGQVSGVNLDKIFKDRRFWHIAPLNFFMAGTLLAVQGLWAGPFLFDVLRLSDLQVGNLLLLMGIGSTLGFSMSGWLADRLGLSRVVIVSGLIFVLTQFILILRPPSVSAISVVYVLFGFAGAFNIMLLAHARQIFPNHMTGQVVSAVNLFGIGGTFLIQWWLGLIIGFYPVESGGHYPPQAYTAAFLFTTIGTLLTLIWYFPVTRLSSESIET